MILVDDRSLAALGRWPLPRGLFAQAVRLMHRAGAKVIVFDLLFAEPDEPLPADLRAAARRAAGGLGAGGRRSCAPRCERLGDSDRDGDFAAAMREAGNVLLPVGFAFTGAAGEAPSWLSDAPTRGSTRARSSRGFRCARVSAVPPIEKLAAAAAGLGHTSVAYDLDGEPRYDYAALPFEADFLPSLPMRAAAAWLGVPWPQVALALGGGVRFGDEVVPTDPAMRLVDQLSRAARHVPDLLVRRSARWAGAGGGACRARRAGGRLVSRRQRQFRRTVRQHPAAGGGAHGQHHRHDRRA